MGHLTCQRVPVTPLRQNCMIVANEAGRAVVVDPGGDVADILSALGNVQVEAIMLTHGHLDHAGGADELRDALSKKQGALVPVLGPDRRDAFLLESICDQAAAFGLPGMRNVLPDQFLEHGAQLSLLGTVFEVRHVPGHTPGHVVFVNQEAGCSFVGDTLFRQTVGRTDFAYGDSEGLIKAIRSELLSLSDEMIVYCGHGMPTTIGEERKNNPFFQ
ncbi:MBL fold metallo-hydrolase [Neokomagataea anthophila]|uniref:MBL fold metallo-hydrolase n=1 Tax=Neokomagataea anthophila TaxID=2826925 RepID=A0ABS5E510_9PROT|nr:MBL fold metallo-hydrolase [Neokomagataea anthophila]MBR0558992.1 MBL fold metallo-hydrolase [Neokomagataea anthophila]